MTIYIDQNTLASQRCPIEAAFEPDAFSIDRSSYFYEGYVTWFIVTWSRLRSIELKIDEEMDGFRSAYHLMGREQWVSALFYTPQEILQRGKLAQKYLKSFRGSLVPRADDNERTVCFRPTGQTLTPARARAIVLSCLHDAEYRPLLRGVMGDIRSITELPVIDDFRPDKYFMENGEIRSDIKLP